MKAAVFARHGPSSVLEIQDVEIPKIDSTEVLIKVKAFALNRLDIWTRNGSPHLEIPFPHIGGSDVAGVIDQIGSDVYNFQIGNRVVINAGLSCGKCTQCLDGEQSLCENFSMIGEHHWGGAAEYIKLPAKNVLIIPENIEFIDAAAIGLTLMTAFRMLHTKARLKKDDLVLIIGATGGVGTALVQLALKVQATVIALSGTEEKSKRLKTMGVQHVINYKKVLLWEKEVYQISREYNKKGVDIVADSVGQKVFEKSIRSLGKGGRYVTCGATSGNSGSINLAAVFWKQLSILGSTMASDGEFRNALQLFFDGEIIAYIDSSYELTDIQHAHERLETGMHFGKIVVTV